MSSLKLISIIISLILTINLIEGQSIETEEQGPVEVPTKTTEVPLFSAVRCNAMIYRDVRNCKETHLPLELMIRMFGNTQEMCCAYRKYKECIIGLKSGLEERLKKERCLSTPTPNLIMSYGENVVGFTIRPRCGADGNRDWCSSQTNKFKNP